VNLFTDGRAPFLPQAGKRHQPAVGERDRVRLHNRMPLVLKPKSWPVWLGAEAAGSSELKALLAPFPARK
jgi:hypothetical protein